MIKDIIIHSGAAESAADQIGDLAEIRIRSAPSRHTQPYMANRPSLIALVKFSVYDTHR